MDSFLFTTKGSRILKYINGVIDDIVETEIYMQFKERCVRRVKMAKSENISKIVYPYLYINVTHIQTTLCILLWVYEGCPESIQPF